MDLPRTGLPFDVRSTEYYWDRYGVKWLHDFDFSFRQSLPGVCAICDMRRSMANGACEECRLAIWWPNKLKDNLRVELASFLDDRQKWHLRLARVFVPRKGKSEAWRRN